MTDKPTCKGTKNDGTPCRTQVGLDKYGYCFRCRKRLEEQGAYPPAESDGGQGSGIVDPAEDTEKEQDGKQDPQDTSDVIDPAPDVPDFEAMTPEEAAELDPQYSYPTSVRCPKCNTTENIVYKSDRERHAQYRACVHIKKHYVRPPRQCPKCGANKPARVCECGFRFTINACPRCGQPGYETERSLTKRWDNRTEKDGTIAIGAQCIIPVCKERYDLQICGTRFPVPGKKI